MTKSINLPRDVFLHLLAIITLVVSAVSFGIIIFECININFPDVVSDQYFSRSGYLSSMRSALATLVIVFPVFLWVSWFLGKDVDKNPEKKDLKIRKWLLYFTLFVAALVIIGDLVALIRSFLEGELSQRFILKVFSILFIAGSVFVHYLSELRDNKYPFIKIFDWAVVLIVVIVVGLGFFVAGTPQSQRLVRLDERRVSDLQNIQWQIVNYWQRKEVLPETLDDLTDPIGGFVLPVDPETGEQYEYSAMGELRFSLCANFSTSSNGADSRIKFESTRPMPVVPAAIYGKPHPDDSNNLWSHDMGRACFERVIDPDLYPPVKINI
ncbi:MAG: DUF5671 domain-containing protein [bacterium]|nr:DUF5671 domain-containing protein [bacterium]